MKRNKLNRNNKRRGNNAMTIGKMVAIHKITDPQPPKYRSNLVTTKRFRFTNGSNPGTYVITAAKLGALISIGTVLNTFVTQFFDTVRLISVELWAPSSSTFVPAQVSVEFTGSIAGVVGSQIAHSDMSIGSTRVAHVKASPHPLSQAAQWQPCDTAGLGSNTLFKIIIPNNAVIDVTVELTVPSDPRTTNNFSTVTTAVLGEIYYLALDNSAGSSGSVLSNLTPDASLNTTK